MKAKIWLFAAALAVAALTGCAGAPEPYCTVDDTAETEAGQKCSALLNAFIANDDKAFEAQLPVELQKTFTAAEFKASRLALADSLGTPKSAVYLDRLKNPVFVILVYKVDFEKITAENQKIEQQALFRAVYAKVDGRLQLISFGFI